MALPSRLADATKAASGRRLGPFSSAAAGRPSLLLSASPRQQQQQQLRRWKAAQVDYSISTSTSSLESSVDESGGSGVDGDAALAARLEAAGVAPVAAADLFDDAFFDPRDVLSNPLLALYFPFGCALAVLRMALWIGGIALDLPLWRNPGVVRGFLALLGVSVAWRHEERLPEGRHVAVSNHVSNGDLLMLFGHARGRYLHLITPLLPKEVFATKNLPAILAPASRDTYEALADIAAAAGGSGDGEGAAAANSSGGSSSTMSEDADGDDGDGSAAPSGGHAVPPIARAVVARGVTVGAPAAAAAAARPRLPPEAARAPVHLFPEGGMTNGRGGMMAFSRGFTRFAKASGGGGGGGAAAGALVAPVALRLTVPFPQVKGHTLTSSFLANLFFFSWQPWARLEATVLPAAAPAAGEGRGAFARRVQEAIALELGAYVVPGFTVSHKRALAASRQAGARQAAAAAVAGKQRQRERRR